MMLPRMDWQPAAPATPEFLAAVPTFIHPLIGQLLWTRGLRDPALIPAFLAAAYNTMPDPFLLRDMDRAVARIREALDKNHKVLVYGDFDVDGVTGTTLLYQALVALGLRVQPYVPHRLNEGYGLHMSVVERLVPETQLLITVDCGISNVQEIGRAQALGVDVIVLDHHTPPDVLPPGYAVINPKRRDCPYPYKMLAGVGLAFKLIQALHQAGLRTGLRGRDLLDLVALGTVSDVAPLNGENRILVRHGLVALNHTMRPGLQALVDAAGVDGRITPETIGFQLGPRINAAGRMDDATIALELLNAPTLGTAQPLAARLNQLNRQRQQLTTSMLERASARIVSEGLDQHPIIVLSDPSFLAGIVGLVASRLVEALGRPIILLAEADGICRGSARSVPDFSIFDALSAVGDLFLKFGGHAQAAGCTLETPRVAELTARLHAYARKSLPARPLKPTLVYDAELPLASVTPDFVDQLTQLEPFGPGHAQPVWVSRRVRVLQAQQIGKEKTHLKLQLESGRSRLDALWWGEAQCLPMIEAAEEIDLAYIVQENHWRGQTSLQLIIKDLAVR